MIDHEDAWVLLPEAATDTLANEAAVQLNSHLEGCSRCRAELTSLRAVAAQLMYATPLEPVSVDAHARLRARLAARATADAALTQPARGASPLPIRSVVRRGANGPAVALAAGIALAASLLALGWALRERHELQSTLQDHDRRARHERQSASQRLDSVDRLITRLTAPAVETIHLTAAGTRATDAAVYWNGTTSGLTLIAHALPRASPGYVYQLWVLTDSAPVSGGIVAPDDHGDATAFAFGNVPHGWVHGFALTEEPGSGSTHPTTPPFLSGRLAR